MFQVMKMGVIDYVEVDKTPTSKTIIEAFLGTGWDESAIVFESNRSCNESARLINRYAEKHEIAVYARSLDGKLIVERMPE